MVVILAHTRPVTDYRKIYKKQSVFFRFDPQRTLNDCNTAETHSSTHFAHSSDTFMKHSDKQLKEARKIDRLLYRTSCQYAQNEQKNVNVMCH
jgi:hypothetical protein